MDQKDHERGFKLNPMQAFYNLPEKDKKRIFEQTAIKAGLPAYAIEKDWWVVQTLRIIFGLEVAEHLTFKGGTSLSKAWNLIERFSEDIDLVLDKSKLGIRQVDTKKKVKELRRMSKKYISDEFKPTLEDAFKKAGFSGLTLKVNNTNPEDNDPIEIQIDYPQAIKYPGYFKPHILVEIGSRSQREPFSLKQISSLVGKHFADKVFADKSIEINTVNPERTFLEKIFLIHELYQGQISEIRTDRMSRHFYDIERMMDSEYADKALSDQVLYNDIVNHRKLMFSYCYVDYSRHQPRHIKLIPPIEIQKDWKKDYETMSVSMIYGEKPKWETLIKRVFELQERINRLDWEIVLI